MKIWFTSDTHFGSERTLQLSKRPFNSVEEMDQTMVNNWNNVVSEHDIVFHLGDFGNYEVSKRLNGNIILIFGNYERKESNDINFRKFNFDKIFPNGISVCYDEKGINLEHEPSRVKYKNIDDKHFNLFGHIHKLCMVKSYGLNVSVDCHNFTPIDLDTVWFYHNAILNHYDDEVFK